MPESENIGEGEKNGQGKASDGSLDLFRQSSLFAKPISNLKSSSFHNVKEVKSFAGSGDSRTSVHLVRSIYSVAPILETKVQIGLLGCVVVIVGCVLGSGIFAAPQEILNITQNEGLTLIIWFTYGLITLLAALCYVELGVTFPFSGGDYAYLNECFGNFPAFLFQWANNWIVTPASSAVMAIVIAKNLINPYNCDGLVAQWASCCLGMVILLLLCYLNCKSSKITETMRGYLMIVNILTISLIVCCGLAHMYMYGIIGNFKVELPQPLQKVSEGETVKFQIVQIVRALYQASFSYFGYTYLGYITEELDNPMRNLPLGVCISIPIVIFLNVFVNFCYMATLPQDVIHNTKTISNEMIRAVLPYPYKKSLSWIAPTLVSIAVMGGLSSSILTCSRVSFSGARNGHFPRIFSLIHANCQTPVVSVAWIGIVGCLFILIGHVPTLIQIAVYLESAFNCACIYGLIYMRFKKPYLIRPIKLPIILPITYAIIATFLFCVPIFTIDKDNAKDMLIGIGGAIFVVFTGIPVYYIFIYKKCEWIALAAMHNKLVLILQKLYFVIPPPEHGKSISR